MTINHQGEPGRLRLFNDFHAPDPILLIAQIRPFGDFLVAGQGVAEVDSGIPTIAGFLSGAGRLTTTNEAEHAILVGTEVSIRVGLMGTIVLEVRVQLENLDTKEVFIGFTDIAPSVLSLEVDVLTGASTTLTLTASDLVGFYLSAELTADESWHAAFNGGTATGVTVSTENDLVVDAVAGEWQVLRLELSPDKGTAKWFIDGVLKKTVIGAVSITTDLGLVVGVEAKGAAVETLDVDYILLKGNRDWNA